MSPLAPVALKQLEARDFSEPVDLSGLTLEDNASSEESEEAYLRLSEMLSRIHKLMQECSGLNSVLPIGELCDMVVLADRVRTLSPCSVKKDDEHLAKSLVITDTAAYILLKSRGGNPIVGPSLCGSLAVKVPFAAEVPCSIVVQLVNKNTALRLSGLELSLREERTKEELVLGDSCPRIDGFYSYRKLVSGVRVEKTMAFIEGQKLGAFHPAVDVLAPLSDRKKKALIEQACKERDVDALVFLKPDLLVSSYAVKVLKDAARTGDIDGLSALVKDGFASRRHLGVALKLAAEHGHEHVVRFLVDTIKLDLEHVTEAIRVAVGAGHERIVMLLLGKSRDYENDYVVALTSAAYYGQVSLFTQLVIKQKYAEQVLSAAISGNKLEVVKLLISLGLLDKEMLKRGFFFAASVREGIDIIKELIPHIKEFSSNGGRAVGIAILAGNAASIKLLLDEGADVNYTDEEGHTLCMLAASEGDLVTLKLLIDNGTDVHATSKDGLTALQIAAQCEHDAVVKFILDKK